MLNKNIAIPEGTRDASGRIVRQGDTLVLLGHFMSDGTFRVDTTSDIHTLTSKIDIPKENA